MAKLTKCLECGKPISSEAKICPHCNTSSPHGCLCGLCLELMPSSSLAEHRKNCIGEKFVDRHFQPKIRDLVVKCKLCRSGKRISLLMGSSDRLRAIEDDRDGVISGSFTCQGCGHVNSYKIRNPYANCDFCDCLLERNKAVKHNRVTTTVRERDDGSYYLSNHAYTGAYKRPILAHQFCYERPLRRQVRWIALINDSPQAVCVALLAHVLVIALGIFTRNFFIGLVTYVILIFVGICIQSMSRKKGIELLKEYSGDKLSI